MNKVSWPVTRSGKPILPLGQATTHASTRQKQASLSGFGFVQVHNKENHNKKQENDRTKQEDEK